MSKYRTVCVLGAQSLCGLLAMALLIVSSGRAQDTNPKNPTDTPPKSSKDTTPKSSPDTTPKSSARGYLGIMVVPAETAERGGVVVRDVAPASPAASAGLRSGDRITKFADADVKDVQSFLQSLGSKKPGEKLTFRVLRNDKEQTIAVTVGQRPSNQGNTPPRGPEAVPGDRRPAFLGVQTQPLAPEERKRLDIRAEGGVIVADVLPNSPAAKAGLKAGDVITAFNERSINDPAQLREAIQRVGASQEVTLKVARGKEQVTLKANLREGAPGQLTTPGDNRFPQPNVESNVAPARRIRELERRIQELEKQLRERDTKQ